MLVTVVLVAVVVAILIALAPVAPVVAVAPKRVAGMAVAPLIALATTLALEVWLPERLVVSRMPQTPKKC